MDMNAYLQQLLQTPGAADEYAKLSSLDSKNAELDQQMQLANAIRTNHSAHHQRGGIGLGGFMAGISDGLNDWRAQRQEADISAQRQANMGQQEAGLRHLLELIRGQQHPQQGMQQPQVPQYLQATQQQMDARQSPADMYGGQMLSGYGGGY